MVSFSALVSKNLLSANSSQECEAVKLFLGNFVNSPLGEDAEKLKQDLMKMSPLLKLSTTKSLMAVLEKGFGKLRSDKMKLKVPKVSTLVAKTSNLPSEVLDFLRFMRKGDLGLAEMGEFNSKLLLPEITSALVEMMEKVKSFELSEARLGFCKFGVGLSVVEWISKHKGVEDKLVKGLQSCVKEFLTYVDGEEGIIGEETTIQELLPLFNAKMLFYGERAKAEPFYNEEEISLISEKKFDKKMSGEKIQTKVEVEIQGTVTSGIAFIEALAHNFSAQTVAARVKPHYWKNTIVAKLINSMLTITISLKVNPLELGLTGQISLAGASQANVDMGCQHISLIVNMFNQ